MEQKLSWREKYAAIVILIIGAGMLGLEVISILSSKASLGTQTDTTISVNKAELFSHLRYLAVAIISIFSAIMLLKRKTVGWILAVPLLLISAAIAVNLIYFSYNMLGFGMEAISVAVLFLIILLAFILLLVPSTRIKYRVGKHTVLPTLVSLMALCAIFFFLQ